MEFSRVGSPPAYKHLRECGPPTACSIIRLPPLQGDWPLMPSFLLLRTANLARRHRWLSLPRLVLLRTQTLSRIHPLALRAHRSTVKARHENTRSPRNPASSPRNFGAARGFNAARRDYA